MHLVKLNREVIELAVKNIESDEVHVGTKGGKTGCGVHTTENPENWVSTNAPKRLSLIKR